MFRIWPNQSDFVKRCPTCSELVAVKDLKKIPRQAEPRWYQLTPASHTACPHCGHRKTLPIQYGFPLPEVDSTTNRYAKGRGIASSCPTVSWPLRSGKAGLPCEP